MNKPLIETLAAQSLVEHDGELIFSKERFAQLIVQQCIWAFGETRSEPSLEKYVLDRLGIENE